MANPQHIVVLKRGLDSWDKWRKAHPEIQPGLEDADLSGERLSGFDFSRGNLSRARFSEADLSGADLTESTLSRANLSDANFSGAMLSKADLSAANLSQTNFSDADFSGANLSGANLVGANLTRANLHEASLVKADLFVADLSRAMLTWADLSGAMLSGADLSGANLSGADLSESNLTHARLWNAVLVETVFRKAILDGSHVYGISAWNLELEGASQKDLMITRHGEPTITVDNLEVADFIYLLLNNEKVRNVIETVTANVVLLLGHFPKERKGVLDAFREGIRRRRYAPVFFDLEKTSSRDLTDPLRTLANMSKFIIIDATGIEHFPQELQAIMPTLAVPIQPVLEESAMTLNVVPGFRGHPWVLEEFRYTNPNALVDSLDRKVISPAEARAAEPERSP